MSDFVVPGRRVCQVRGQTKYDLRLEHDPKSPVKLVIVGRETGKRHGIVQLDDTGVEDLIKYLVEGMSDVDHEAIAELLDDRHFHIDSI